MASNNQNSFLYVILYFLTLTLIMFVVHVLEMTSKDHSRSSAVMRSQQIALTPISLPLEQCAYLPSFSYFFYCNYVPVSYGVRDVMIYWLKIANFLYHTCIQCPLQCPHQNFDMIYTCGRTSIMETAGFCSRIMLCISCTMLSARIFNVESVIYRTMSRIILTLKWYRRSVERSQRSQQCFFNVFCLVTVTFTYNTTTQIIPIPTRGQSNLTKSAHSPVRGHPRGSKVVPLTNVVTTQPISISASFTNVK